MRQWTFSRSQEQAGSGLTSLADLPPTTTRLMKHHSMESSELSDGSDPGLEAEYYAQNKQSKSRVSAWSDETDTDQSRPPLHLIPSSAAQQQRSVANTGTSTGMPPRVSMTAKATKPARRSVQTLDPRLAIALNERRFSMCFCIFFVSCYKPQTNNNRCSLVCSV